MSIRKRSKKTHRQRKREKMVTVQIKLDPLEMQQLDAYRLRYGLSREKAIQKALEKFKKFSDNEIEKIVGEINED